MKDINEINQRLIRKFLDNLIKHLDYITDPRPMTMDDLKLPKEELNDYQAYIGRTRE